MDASDTLHPHANSEAVVAQNLLAWFQLPEACVLCLPCLVSIAILLLFLVLKDHRWPNYRV